MAAQNFTIMTRPATFADLPTIAQIHKAAYSEVHFTSLLPSAVLESYYRYFLGDGAEIVVAIRRCALDQAGEEIVGFAVFGYNVPSLIARFKQERRSDIMRAALRHPIISARKLVSQIRARLSTYNSKPPCDYLLLSIAVKFPRSGVGTLLLSTLLDRARDLGCEKVGLYVNVSNVGAINRYCKHGFRFNSMSHNQFYMEMAI
jgi:ribosomal protein S18 acetylase RimI-like enzyme